MSSYETRLDYSHRNVEYLPEDVINANQSVTLLDASNNNIRDVDFVEKFVNLNSLILDHNCIASDAVFPHNPQLTTLWLNFNNIDELIPFVDNLKISFPNLKHLSMMGNKASPPCTEDTFYEYLQYRLQILSYFDGLEHLDDRSVSQDEREEAARLYGPSANPSIADSAASNISDFVQSLFDKVFSFIDAPTTGRRTRYGGAASVI
ncbi:Hypothetical protein NTJ_08608 [Nesidiocoris tenuis]|uniref:U2A'/phosphoprotein 32 family A C-terminal domain-containing protein n=1 Tax=Nesidiocoris tenuis TaxID=355587 RepID=A0ABN7AUD1_9HEMI|nr:Hypothetical protein NTJ_08608 [Nesidiocoris tenuis]